VVESGSTGRTLVSMTGDFLIPQRFCKIKFLVNSGTVDCAHRYSPATAKSLVSHLGPLIGPNYNLCLDYDWLRHFEISLRQRK
jgi:hypothetical protein